jgi:flagellar basal-body rod modification protein FlgD
MSSGIQQRISPFSSPNTVDLSTGKSSIGTNIETEVQGAEKVIDFGSLLQRSNFESKLSRVAKENGGDLVAESDEELRQKMAERTNPNANKKPSNEMDKDAFLKLFVTQMKNQDPLNPDDSAKMAANLAQFQGLEQMTNVNTNLEKLANAQAKGRAVSLIDYVGKEVKLDGGRFKLENGKTTDANFSLKEQVPAAILQVRDASGAVVSKKAMGNLSAGSHEIKWGGKGDDGKTIADGLYTFTVVATNMQGEEIPVDISSTVKVTGVDMQAEGGGFFTALGKISVDQIKSIGEQSYAKNAMAPISNKPKSKEKMAARKANVAAIAGANSAAASAGVPPDVMAKAQAAMAAQMGLNPGNAQVAPSGRIQGVPAAPQSPARTGAVSIPEPGDSVPMPSAQQAIPQQAAAPAKSNNPRS